MFGKRSGLDIPAFGDAHFASREEMEAAALVGEKGIRLGYYRTPGDRRGWGQVIRYNGDGGLMMVAPPRTGKARDVLVGALLEYPQSCIVVDPKGQLAAITKAHRERPKSEGGLGQRVFVLNPFDVWPDLLGPSAHYNPMMLLDPASNDWAADCAKLAEGLIARDSEKDSHWTSGARSLLTGIIGQLAAHGREEKKNLAEVRRIITEDFELEDPETKKLVRKPLLPAVAQAAMKSPHAFIRQALASYANENPHNPGELGSFKQNAKEQTEFLGLETMARNLTGTGEFRFADLKETPTTVYIILPDNRLDVCGKWFRLVIASALDDLWRGEKGTYRVLAILDEFAQIGHLKVLEDSAGAAAGRGVQLWPVIQNIPQLKKDYGEVWETFLSGSDIRQFFAPRDQTTAKYVSETVGQRTVTTAGQSVQDNGLFGDNRASDSSGQAGQPLIRPHEISGFGPNESLVIGPRNIIVDGLRQPYFHTPEFAGLYDPDPMHKRDAAPPPPVKPEPIVTFADTLAGGAERTAAARDAQRPLALRLLMWGSSRNPVLNALRKAEYLITLPLRLVGALLAAPFAVHNKPLGALLGFLALFGFWEIWDGFAKQPFLAFYGYKQDACYGTVYTADSSHRGHYMDCKIRALRETTLFFWKYVIVYALTDGPIQMANDFDTAYRDEIEGRHFITKSEIEADRKASAAAAIETEQMPPKTLPVETQRKPEVKQPALPIRVAHPFERSFGIYANHRFMVVSNHPLAYLTVGKEQVQRFEDGDAGALSSNPIAPLKMLPPGIVTPQAYADSGDLVKAKINGKEMILAYADDGRHYALILESDYAPYRRAETLLCKEKGFSSNANYPVEYLPVTGEDMQRFSMGDGGGLALSANLSSQLKMLPLATAVEPYCYTASGDVVKQAVNGRQLIMARTPSSHVLLIPESDYLPYNPPSRAQ